jgi:Nif-specific regulatory protein
MKASTAITAASQGREARRLSTLLEVSQALSGTLNIKSAFHRVLEIPGRHHGALRSMVVMLRDGGELYSEASDGLDRPSQSVQYRLGEGITGRVVETGKPIVVPRVSREPTMLNRAARRTESDDQELSFVCVPILLNRRAVGALGVDLRYKAERDFESSVKFMGVVASMLATAVKIQRLIEEDKRRLVDENEHLRQELREKYDFSNIIGTSGPVRQVYEQVAQVAATNTTVLIRGESGTGKELIAHAIHYNSLRAKKPFVKVSCAALPESLIEAELFGHERARLPAPGAQEGRFELAGRHAVSRRDRRHQPVTRVKLLRVLREREFEQVGGTETIKVNVRMIAATNKDMEGDRGRHIPRGLYYRLNVFSIFVPPATARPISAAGRSLPREVLA